MQTEAVVAAAITVLVLVGFFLLRRHLMSLEKGRKKRITKVKDKDFFATHINEHVDVATIKQQNLDSLEKRFTITKRALYGALLVGIVLLGTIPLMGQFPSTILSIVVACISVVVGIAAKPVIENLICGLVLCFGKLARIGDIVLVDGEYGSIEDVTLTHCIIRRWDWLRYVVPNSSMMTKEFLNYSLRDNHRWVHVEFWVDYKADISLVEQIAIVSPESSEYYSKAEAPRFWIVDFTPESAKCMLVAWATSAADGWMLSIDIRKNLLLEFQKHNIQTHMQRIQFNKEDKPKQKG